MVEVSTYIPPPTTTTIVSLSQTSSHPLKKYLDKRTRTMKVKNKECKKVSEMILISFMDITELIIGDYCFKSARKFLLDRMSELRKITVGCQSFTSCFSFSTGDPEHHEKRVKEECRTFVIKKCESLEEIEINRRSFADFYVLQLIELNKLRVFRIKGSTNWDAKCEGSFYHLCGFYIGQLPSLEVISIEGSRVFSACPSVKLSDLPSLTTVSVSGHQAFRETAYIEMKRLPRLYSIDLYGNHCMCGWKERGPCKLFLEDVPNVGDMNMEVAIGVLNNFVAIKRGRNVSEEMIRLLKKHISKYCRCRSKFRVEPLEIDE